MVGAVQSGDTRSAAAALLSAAAGGREAAASVAAASVAAAQVNVQVGYGGKSVVVGGGRGQRRFR